MPLQGSQRPLGISCQAADTRFPVAGCMPGGLAAYCKGQAGPDGAGDNDVAMEAACADLGAGDCRNASVGTVPARLAPGSAAHRPAGPARAARAGRAAPSGFGPRRVPQPAGCEPTQAVPTGLSRQAFLAGVPHLTSGSPCFTAAVSVARRKVRGAALRTKRSIPVWAWWPFAPAATPAFRAEAGHSWPSATRSARTAFAGQQAASTPPSNAGIDDLMAYML